MRALAVGMIAVLAVVGLVSLGDVREDFEERCTEPWRPATTIDVSRPKLAPEDVGRISPSARDVEIAGRAYSIDPRINKSMGGASAPVNPFHRKRIGAYFTAVAKDEATLRALKPLCVRATLGGDVWHRRVHTHNVYSQGITGKAVGGAGAGHGPEWPVDATVRLAFLVSIDGARYVLEAAAVPIIGSD